jgi:hypothetical protein
VTDRTKAFLEGSLTKQVAILTLQRDTEQAISDQLGITVNKVKALKRTDEFWNEMREEAEATCKVLRARFQKKLEHAEHHAWENFLYHLKEKRTLEAVKIYIEMIGLKAKESGENDTPAVTIMMPGAQPAPKDVVVDAVEVKPSE